MLMIERDYDNRRVTWTTRINIRPSAMTLVRTLADHDRMSVATVLGLAVESYVTSRSSNDETR